MIKALFLVIQILPLCKSLEYSNYGQTVASDMYSDKGIPDSK